MEALASGRRRGLRQASDRDYVTELIATGELGKEDGEVLKRIMQHVCAQMGIKLVETDYSREARVGEYVHLATKDVAAPPGRLQLRLPNLDSLRKVRGALHGQSVQVGSDIVGFRVANDMLDAEGIPGGALRDHL